MSALGCDTSGCKKLDSNVSCMMLADRHGSCLAGDFPGDQHALHIGAPGAQAGGNMQERLHAGPQRGTRERPITACCTGRPADLSAATLINANAPSER